MPSHGNSKSCRISPPQERVLICRGSYIVYIVILVFQLIAAYLTFVETNGLTVETVCEYFKDDPKWFAGPKSKKLLLEYNEKTLATLQTEGSDKHLDSQSDSKDGGVTSDVLPVV